MSMAHVFSEEGISRYPVRYPVQIWRRRWRNDEEYGEMAQR